MMDTHNTSATTPGPRLAVCSWSLQPAGPEALIEKLLATGIRRVQLALDPLREAPPVWAETENLFRRHEITVVSGMVGCLGEDYSTLESIRLTGGIVPDATWAENRKNIGAAAVLAGQMGLKLVTLHAGFVPESEGDRDFGKLCGRLGEVADIFQAQGVGLGLETGQETAAALTHLLGRLNHPNLGVNFDPANLILYGKGDPVAALRVLAPWVRQVHIKDARRTRQPGTWGEEVVAGTGDVDWPKFFAALAELNPAVNLAIEREQGTERVADIRAARLLVEKFFN